MSLSQKIVEQEEREQADAIKKATAELRTENERYRRALSAIRYGLTLPENNIQRAIRERADAALENRPIEYKRTKHA